MAKSASHHGSCDAIKDRRSTPTVDDISLQREPCQVHKYTDLHSHGSRRQVFRRVSLDYLPTSSTHARDEAANHREERYAMGISRPPSSGSDEGYIPSPPPRPPSANRSMIRVRSARQRPTSSRPSQEPADFPNATILRPPSSFNKFHPLPSIESPERLDPVISSTQNLSLSPRSKCDTDTDNDTRYDTNTDNKHDRHHRQSDLDPKHDTNKDIKHTHHHRQFDVDPRHDTNKDCGPDICHMQSIPLGSESVFKKSFSSLRSLPPEPSEDEGRLLLAVKLPTDGSRHQRYFSTEDYLQDVLHFAEDVNREDLSQYVLASNVPRRVFSNLRHRLCDVDIQDKTLLYFEKK